MYIDFMDYAPGAALATDLVNTAPLVRTSIGEVLTDPAALRRFLDEHGVEVSAAPLESDVARTHSLRNDVRAVLESTDEDETVARASALVLRGARGPVLHRDSEGRWQWHVVTARNADLADELAVRIGLGLLGALHTLGHKRFRHCAAPDCAGLFVDTSRAGRRRYCMPDLCGNRINVANYRARQQN